MASYASLAGFLGSNSGGYLNAPTTAASTITVQDEGTTTSSIASTLNFVGPGVVTSGAGAIATVTISGGASGTAGGDLAGTYPNPTLGVIGAGGSVGDATNVAQITYDTKGRVTGASNVAIAFPSSTLTVQDEGVTTSTTVTTVNFVGQDIVASGAGAITTFTKGGLTTTVSSATPIVLTAASNRIQIVTGTATQAITLPVVATAPASNGYSWEIHNDSTLATTVSTSGGNLLASVASGSWGIATIVNTGGGTGTASWNWGFGLAAGLPVMDNNATPTYATAPQTQGCWYGRNTKANCANFDNVCIGETAVASSTQSTAVGSSATAGGSGTAVGSLSNAVSFATAIGRSAIATGTSGSLAVGYNTQATNVQATSIGQNITNSGDGATVVGSACTNTGNNTVILGKDSSSTAAGVAIVGQSCVTSVTNSALFGRSATVASSAYASGFGTNASSVAPGQWGITLNSDSRQIEVYSTIFSTTVTAAGTTTLMATSSKKQYFTGATTQTVVLPVATTLSNGFEFKVVNLSTGTVTINTSGGNNLVNISGATLPIGRWVLCTCIDTGGGTGTASWSCELGG